MQHRLGQKEIQEAKEFLLEQQGYICPLCDKDLSEEPNKNLVLDHDHKSGMIRAALCRNCNHMAGFVEGCANRAKRSMTRFEWLHRMVEYVIYHEENPSGVYHPTFKTEQEKRDLRNKRARKRRKQKKDKKSD